MLNQDQLKILAKKYKINNTVILREYYQISFLNELYKQKFSQSIFFKGGTAIHLLFGGERFSEDLDFTVEESIEEFTLFFIDFLKKLEQLFGWTFKDRNELTGKTYLMTIIETQINFKIFIKLDFSFREKVLSPSKSILKTDYPILFSHFIYNLSIEEILAEKIRAILTRSKGRDIYDLWFLLNKGAVIQEDLVLEKLKYYQTDSYNKQELLDRILKFSQEQFVLDLRPFVSINQREKLPEFYSYVVQYIKEKMID